MLLWVDKYGSAECGFVHQVAVQSLTVFHVTANSVNSEKASYGGYSLHRRLVAI